MNKSLLFGLIVTAVMLAAAAFGPQFAPHGLEDQVEIHFFINDKGEGDMIAPPVAPSKDYLFGTDRNGYDILTKLLHGAKYTVFLAIGIALARVLIGGIAGMFLGYYGNASASGKRKSIPYWNVLNGIPVFLMIWFIVYGISYNPSASPTYLAVVLGVIFVAIGLPAVVGPIRDKAVEIKERQFVMASKSIGANHWTIIRSHLFPHLKESFVVLFVNEIILILTLFGQLAIFNIFVGGTIMTFDPVEYFTRTNEWAGLIGQARNGIYVHQWILFFPLAVYVTLIVGFYFVSKGLETLYKDKYSKFSHI
ncbi:ABC transporter permease subunit [Paenibacillus sp.]|uniref:ABC transporter permease n=1 Tax=Paenibacillus sp. TaxID=58172 RepID=UPI002811FB4C|nr:ABC transporter permease subunit [Paenibacillus sp.]